MITQQSLVAVIQPVDTGASPELIAMTGAPAGPRTSDEMPTPASVVTPGSTARRKQAERPIQVAHDPPIYRASIALVVAEGGDIMVQETSPGQGSQGGFRVGASHDASTRTGTTPFSAGDGKLPPIEWMHTDIGKIMRQDLAGLGKALVVGLIGMAVLIAISIGVALAVTAVLNAVGVDPSASY
jgi:hypothetical protein